PFQVGRRRTVAPKKWPATRLHSKFILHRSPFLEARVPPPANDVAPITDDREPGRAVRNRGQPASPDRAPPGLLDQSALGGVVVRAGGAGAGRPRARARLRPGEPLASKPRTDRPELVAHLDGLLTRDDRGGAPRARRPRSLRRRGCAGTALPGRLLRRRARQPHAVPRSRSAASVRGDQTRARRGRRLPRLD